MDIFTDSRAARGNETRRRILDAAVRVFSSKGYHDTRVDEIVEASHTSKGAVYFHFPGKQEVFLTIIEELANLLEGKLAEAITDKPDGVARVDAALSTCLQTFRKYRRLAKIFLVQAVGLGAAFEEKRLEIHDRFVRIIKTYLDQAIEEGEIAPLDTEVAAYAWMGAINEVIIKWVHTGQPEPDRIYPTLRAMLLRSVGVSEQRIRELEAAPEAP